MDICKESEVKGIGKADEGELALINRLTRREMMADEVYTFAVRLCDNDIDRDGERFADETLKELGQLFDELKELAGDLGSLGDLGDLSGIVDQTVPDGLNNLPLG